MLSGFTLTRPASMLRSTRIRLLPMAGLEPGAGPFYGPTDFKSVASAISPHRRRNRAEVKHGELRTPKRIRRDLLLDLRRDRKPRPGSTATLFNLFQKLENFGLKKPEIFLGATKIVMQEFKPQATRLSAANGFSPGARSSYFSRRWPEQKLIRIAKPLPKMFPFEIALRLVRPNRQGRLNVIYISLAFQLLWLSGCNTYTSENPRGVNGQGQAVDETANHYGQPYFLPKGLIHLVIKPEASGGGTSTANATSANTPSSVTISNYNGIGPTPSPTPGASPAGPAGSDAVSKEKEQATAKEDDFVSPKAYTITASRVIVPDQSQGPFTARYNTNWFYSDNISIGVTDDGLLTTLAADLSDRTPQIIYNVADTAANVVKAMAYASFKRAQETAKAVKYRRLNIDVTFDPFDKNDVKAVRALFDNVTTDEAIYLSPFVFDLSRVPTGSLPGESAYLSERKPKGAGLWFRELTPVEIILTASTDAFIKKVSSQRKLPIKDAEERVAINAKIKKLKDNPPNNSAPKEEQDKYKQALKEANDELKKLKGVSGEELASAETIAITQQTSRSTRLVISVPNKERTFAFNIPRSAFVQNKKLNLTISSGLLTKVELVKPSEAEGFSQIPLTVSQKLLQLPKDLLTIRTEKVNAARDQSAAANAAFNSQEQLQQSIATRQDALKTAELTAEKNRLQAEIDLLQKQKALIQAQGANNPPLAPGSIPTPTP
jgi:hypothetical protein